MKTLWVCRRLRVLWYDYHNFRLVPFRLSRWRALSVAVSFPSATDVWDLSVLEFLKGKIR
ncbi:hypothetical protein LCGC14_0461620 [marine sediment metagenome]|uniref:Uncharacterized protein n=1 Tax=marine sediment metagenome TaxID=412755 RepID=A0A0F9SK26_9ZZZZ